MIGVVMGKAELMRTNLMSGQTESVGKSDLAISLPYLWNFLEDENVSTVTIQSAIMHGQSYLERMASEYIVNIHCMQ